MTIEMGGLSYAGHNMHGLSYGTIEGGLDYGVHRAVATHGQGLHGLSYGEPTMMDTVKSKLSEALDYAKENWVMLTLGAVGAVLVAKYVLKMDVPLLSNPRRRRKKRKQTAKQRAASLRNLRKARAKAGKRRGSKLSRARKSLARKARGGGKRAANQQKRVVVLMRAGYSMADAWRIVKTGRKTAPKRTSRRRKGSRSRSRR